MISPTPRGRRALVAGIVLLATLVRAVALEWEVTELSFTTKPFQPTQEALFAYRNSGTKAVTLLDIQTNCDCLHVTVDRRIVPPGERGTIKAILKVGERPGVTERIVTIVTDDAPAPVRLRVRVEVPPIAIFDPATVSWRLSEPANVKTIDVKPAAGVELDLTAARATNSAFTVRLETVELGRHYRVLLTPAGTSQPASAAIRLSGKEKSGRDVVLSVYATVQ